MASKALLMFMPLALAMVANCSTTATTFNKTLAHFGTGDGALWTVNIEDIETETTMMMDSETNRWLRNGTKRRYISYEALKRNNVPCHQQGRSYYECSTGKPVNPYTRGCTYATRCRRYTA
ncbi:protein RALF-like 4 [Gossypium raimondii]|uniref:Protein RALF-like 19 n=1 Tax=Gossypium raimondii TaxID=29730 RepID=A0A0D2SYX7_GOSRA|nr:protein RALF-like 4 [Gossypium raimondii]KJB68643.1 hypothetical protein B456_010G256000 [Gossypium raimondii]